MRIAVFSVVIVASLLLTWGSSRIEAVLFSEIGLVLLIAEIRRELLRRRHDQSSGSK